MVFGGRADRFLQCKHRLRPGVRTWIKASDIPGHRHGLAYIPRRAGIGARNRRVNDIALLQRPVQGYSVNCREQEEERVDRGRDHDGHWQRRRAGNRGCRGADAGRKQSLVHVASFPPAHLSCSARPLVPSLPRPIRQPAPPRVSPLPPIHALSHHCNTDGEPLVVAQSLSIMSNNCLFDLVFSPIPFKVGFAE